MPPNIHSSILTSVLSCLNYSVLLSMNRTAGFIACAWRNIIFYSETFTALSARLNFRWCSVVAGCFNLFIFADNHRPDICSNAIWACGAGLCHIQKIFYPRFYAHISTTFLGKIIPQKVSGEQWQSEQAKNEPCEPGGATKWVRTMNWGEEGRGKS